MNERKETSLLAINKDIIEKHLSPLLSLKDLSRLTRTYKGRNYFLKQFQEAKITRFLEFVAFGKQSEAEEILKKHPELLRQCGTVTDYSGRTFEGITAFQYALWALDRHMWTMILKYLPRGEAKQQLYDHVYGKKKYKALHGSHYDFVPLIDALQAYVDNFRIWSDDQRIEHWYKKVGGAQRLVPVHVANEYCREDRSFYPQPKFDEDYLPRSLFFYNYLRKKLIIVPTRDLWFPLLPGHGVGVDLAILRTWYFAGGVLATLQLPTRPEWDLTAITALCKVRTNEFVDLKEQLLNAYLIEQEVNSTPQEKSSCVIS